MTLVFIPFPDMTKGNPVTNKPTNIAALAKLAERIKERK
ncbi:MAG: hypothetical protein JWQ74_3544 [Marmoricola sp.]|nr:hypothetical protein [Marmoricola sp.]